MVNIVNIYAILTKHYEQHSSLLLTREVKSNHAFFHNINCSHNMRQLIEAMNAMSQSDEMPVKSLE